MNTNQKSFKVPMIKQIILLKKEFLLYRSENHSMSFKIRLRAAALQLTIISRKWE